MIDRERAGAAPPGELQPPSMGLNMLNTPANRRLARALRAAYQAAVEVDRERGYQKPSEPEEGPTARSLIDLLVRVEEEVCGPARRGEGGEV